MKTIFQNIYTFFKKNYTMIRKKHVITFILLLFIQYGYSQNRFETGYYISNNGSKIDCLIEKKRMGNLVQ